MSPLSCQRRNVKGLLPWLLSYLFLMQALMPIQGHTQWVVDAQGHVIVICSLQGERTAMLPGAPDSSVALDEYLSPACLFSQLMGSSVAATPFATPTAVLGTITRHSPPRYALPVLQRTRAQAIRAPPLA